MTVRSSSIQWTAAGLLAVLILVTRLTAHLPNMTPVLGVALFAGFFLHRRGLAIGSVIAGMVAADLVLGFYSYEVMLVVYASLLLPIVLRTVLRRRLSVARVGLSALACSVVFYLTTNFAHWYFMGAEWYPRTVAGLIECYAVALPFFKYQLAGDAVWTLMLFGSFAAAHRYVKSVEARTAIA